MSFSVFLSMYNCIEWGPTVGNRPDWILQSSAPFRLRNHLRERCQDLAKGNYITSLVAAVLSLGRRRNIGHPCPKLICFQPHIRNHHRQHGGSLVIRNFDHFHHTGTFHGSAILLCVCKLVIFQALSLLVVTIRASFLYKTVKSWR